MFPTLTEESDKRTCRMLVSWRDRQRALVSVRFPSHPWVRVLDPVTAPGEPPRELDLPPSGFVAGIYARNDIEKGVHKAPANEVVRSLWSSC